jgi:hypothetical protein
VEIYPEKYTIDTDGTIFKCIALEDLYNDIWLNIDNYEGNFDLWESIKIKESPNICISLKDRETQPEMPYDKYPWFYEQDNRKT